MKRNRITLIAAITLLITLAAVAQPRPRPRGAEGPGPGGPGGMRGPGIERLADVLDLSDAQKSQAEALRATLEATVEPLGEQRRANHEAIKAAIDANDATAAGNAVIANAKLREQMKAAHDAFRTSFTAILTAEQKAKFEMLEEMRKSRRPGPPPQEP